MFKKKICQKCGEKINNKYEFCPYCGNSFNENLKEENLGMLGKNDFSSINGIKLPMGLNMIFNSLIKNLNRQFKDIDKEIKEPKTIKKGFKQGGISINISTSGGRPPEIKVNSFGNNPKFNQPIKKQIKEKPLNNLSYEKLKKISELPKQEPATNIRRLSDKVIYEIQMPEVKSVKDISIIKLENSIEIKALTKDKAYSKLIPINLPITDYNLSEGKLILELGVKN